MSSSNVAATPQGGGVEHFDGPAEAPSALNVGAPNDPREQQMVTAMPCMLPSYLYTQMIFMTAISWDSSQRPGQIIWKTPLHPVYMNMFISYFAGVFNLWAGSFDFEFIVAGTGFNGGKLVICWIPPNKDPSKMSLADFTTYSYGFIDPKVATAITINARDERIQKAHWLDYDPTADLDDQPMLEKYAAIGGYIALVVMNPLISSSLEKTNVNISILNKCGSDFTMDQFVPPQKRGGSSQKPLPDITFESAHCPHWHTVEMDTMHIGTLSVSASIDPFRLVNIRTGEFSLFPASERLWSVNWYKDVKYKLVTYEGDTGKPCSGVTDPKPISENPTVEEQKQMVAGRYLLFTDTVGECAYLREHDNPTSYVPSDIRMGSYDDANHSAFNVTPHPAKNYDLTGIIPPFVNYQTDTTHFCRYGVVDGDASYSWQQVKSDLNESLVTFGWPNDLPVCGAPVTWEIQQLFQKGLISTDLDVVYQVRDIASDQILSIVRLNNNGLFTAAKSKTIVKFELKKIKLVFQSFLDHSAKLPQYPNMAANLAVYQNTRENERLRDHSARQTELITTLWDRMMQYEHGTSECGQSGVDGEQHSSDESDGSERGDPFQALFAEGEAGDNG